MLHRMLARAVGRAACVWQRGGASYYTPSPRRPADHWLLIALQLLLIAYSYPLIHAPILFTFYFTVTQLHYKKSRDKNIV